MSYLHVIPGVWKFNKKHKHEQTTTERFIENK